MSKENLIPLYKTVWETRSARYNASRRLSRRAMVSNLVIAATSIGLVLLSVLVPTQNYEIVVKISSLVGALAILVLSMWDTARNTSVRSDRLLRCAQELDPLYAQIKQSIDSGNEKLPCDEDFQKKYSAIIKNCTENHEPIDYALHIVENSKDYPDKQMCKPYRKAIWHLSYLDIAIYTAILFLVLIPVGTLISTPYTR